MGEDCKEIKDKSKQRDQEVYEVSYPGWLDQAGIPNQKGNWGYKELGKQGWGTLLVLWARPLSVHRLALELY